MEQKPVPHVLVFPFPAQGHVNSMLKLAELLALEGLHVTFLNTEYNHDRLLRFTDAKTRFSELSCFRFETISDGLPKDHNRSYKYINDLLHSVKTVMPSIFRDILVSGHLESEGWPPVTCIIADGLLTFTIDVATEIGISSISFRTTSVCYFWACFCIPILIEAGVIPFEENVNMDETITCIPGLEGFARYRDLPSFCRAKELSNPSFQFVLSETLSSARASAQIFNTFQDLEGQILSQLQPHFPKIYTIGPIHSFLSSKCKDGSQASNSLLEVDRSCMAWLDAQSPKSVIYVSFGSVIFMTEKQMLEFWHGLVNSEKQFLWVIRPDSVMDRDDAFNIPEEIQEGTKQRGYIVDWSPQEEVLKHPAVGGFLTHSGWNSTLECLAAGVPMVCWPHWADQLTNSRYISEMWKIGLDMKDTCDRFIVERMVRDIMEDKREEIMRSVDKMADMAKKCITEGGSSYSNMNRLVEDITLLRLKPFDVDS